MRSGGTQAFAPESLAAVDRPMVVSGAPAGSSGRNLDTESCTLIGTLPEAGSRQFKPDTLAHFDVLGVRTEDRLKILRKDEPDDFVACEQGTEDRRAEHDAIASEMLDFFSGLSGK